MAKQDDQKLKRRGEFEVRVLQQRRMGAGHKGLYLGLDPAAAAVFGQARAGQFVQIACRDLHDGRCATPLLRRPFSIAGVRPATDPEGGILQLEILYRVIGPGTQWLGKRDSGDVINLLGPLGNGFSLPEESSQKVILMGGGIGLPPMFFLGDQLRERNVQDILAFAGARMASHFEAAICPKPPSREHALEPHPLLEQFNRNGIGCIMATDDGSMGFQGTVVQAADQWLERHAEWQGARIYACGPYPMLKAAAELAERLGMSCQVCMEEYMACGIGLCQSCAVPVRNDQAAGQKQYKLVCANGPVFDAETIVWEER